jgi:chaperone BCS1
MNSVILDEDLSRNLMEDIEKFQNSADWYLSKGVPYRRGYLLYGPPGTGKTSFT